MNEQLNPSHIMQTATAFWGSKTLLTAVEFDLFTVLGDGSMTAIELSDELGLHLRASYDFLDALVALKFLERDGDGAEGNYKNTPETAAFLGKQSPTYVGGFLKMLNSRLYSSWNNLGNALKTGDSQGDSFYEEVYASESKLEEFLEAMSGIQKANYRLLAEKFDFSRYTSVSDIGGALGILSQIVGKHHKHLTFTTFDLAPVLPHAKKSINHAGMSDRIDVISGDFFVDDLPQADVITMGNVLHNWNHEKKKILIQKAYDALPEGGAFIAIEHLIDDARRENAFSLLMSLNMLLELGDAFDYTGSDFHEWCTEIGFTSFEVLPLSGPSSAAIAYK